VGQFLTTPGPIMAAVDTFEIHITGVGGHGAMPHETVDPIPAAIAIAQAMPDHRVAQQLRAGRSGDLGHADPCRDRRQRDPETAFINGTVRSFDRACRTWSSGAWARSSRVIGGLRGQARLDYIRGYPATINDPEATPSRPRSPRGRGRGRGRRHAGREMGAEDFAYMLEERPGAYLFLGAGPGAGLHHPEFDFNDAIAPIGRELLRAAGGDGAARLMRLGAQVLAQPVKQRLALMRGDDGGDLADADVMRADPFGRDQAAVEADQRLGQARRAGGHGLGLTALNLSPPGAGRREEKTSEISVCPVRSTLMQKHLFSSTSGRAEARR
jgi:hypothetical protein